MNSTKYKEDFIVIEKNLTAGCSQRSELDLHVDMIVPSVPPTDCITSNVCKVAYSIRVVGLVSGCHSNPELIIPIVIGTVPHHPSTLLPMTITTAETFPSADSSMDSSKQACPDYNFLFCNVVFVLNHSQIHHHTSRPFTVQPICQVKIFLHATL